MYLAAMALAHAGIDMRDMIASVAVGKVGHDLCADLDKKEEDFEGEGGISDIPIAVIPSTGKITLLQMDGEISREDLKKTLELGIKVAGQITKLQRDALKAVYKGE